MAKHYPILCRFQIPSQGLVRKCVQFTHLLPFKQVGVIFQMKAWYWAICWFCQIWSSFDNRSEHYILLIQPTWQVWGFTDTANTVYYTKKYSVKWYQIVPVFIPWVPIPRTGQGVSRLKGINKWQNWMKNNQ